MTVAFLTVVEALAHWQDRDKTPLRGAVVPPCDALRDEIYDIALAVVFRDIASLDSVTERALRIQMTIEVNRPQLAHLHSIDREYQPEAIEAAARLGAMVAVLERWLSAILDVGAREHVEGRRVA